MRHWVFIAWIAFVIAAYLDRGYANVPDMVFHGITYIAIYIVPAILIYRWRCKAASKNTPS